MFEESCGCYASLLNGLLWHVCWDCMGAYPGGVVKPESSPKQPTRFQGNHQESTELKTRWANAGVRWCIKTPCRNEVPTASSGFIPSLLVLSPLHPSFLATLCLLVVTGRKWNCWAQWVVDVPKVGGSPSLSVQVKPCCWLNPCISMNSTVVLICSAGVH
jgi:hypothetical protein